MGKVKALLSSGLNRIKNFRFSFKFKKRKETSSEITDSLQNSVGGKVSRIKQFLLFPFKHPWLSGSVVFSAALVILMGISVYRGYFMTAASQGTSSAEIPTTKKQLKHIT